MAILDTNGRGLDAAQASCESGTVWAFDGAALAPSLFRGDQPPPLRPGDVVRLKSSGPRMTVRELTHLGALCQWFQVTAFDRVPVFEFHEKTFGLCQLVREGD